MLGLLTDLPQNGHISVETEMEYYSNSIDTLRNRDYSLFLFG